jgi:hypothetical protein
MLNVLLAERVPGCPDNAGHSSVPAGQPSKDKHSAAASLDFGLTAERIIVQVKSVTSETSLSK